MLDRLQESSRLLLLAFGNASCQRQLDEATMKQGEIEVREYEDPSAPSLDNFIQILISQ